MIKAVFFDLDGTLLSPQTGFCSPATKAALLALKKKGIKLCVATGRSPYEFTLTPIIEGLPFDAIVALNGLCCYDSEGIIYQRLFDKEDLSLLIDKVTAVNCPCTIIKRDDMYINLVNDHVRQAHAAIHAPTPRTGELSNALTEDVIMAMVYHPVGGDADDILSVLRKSHATRWHPYSVDVVPNGCSKKTGIDEVLKKYTKKYTLTKIRTTDLGSLFELCYTVMMKKDEDEQEFINELRCRNGNLNIALLVNAPKVQ